MSHVEPGETQKIAVLIFGGWSPGPLLYLKRSVRQRCTFLEPDIPMPPVGCSWCIDISMVALLGVVAVTIWACVAVAHLISSRALLVVVRILIVVVGIIFVRLCVARVVRKSIDKGVTIAQSYMRRQSDVAIVIGFSWGGGVVAEMLRLGLVGGPGQPAVVMIAPTTALMGSFAMRKDAALSIHVADADRVHVFHATNDGTFCPHSERWGLTGATTHLCNDNHVFCRRESLDELAHVLKYMIIDG